MKTLAYARVKTLAYARVKTLVDACLKINIVNARMKV